MYKDHETPRFWSTYSEELRRYVEKRVQDRDLANDIMHEMYLKVFCYCKRFDFCCEKAGVKNLRSWLYGICYNLIMDHYNERNITWLRPAFSDMETCNDDPPALLLWNDVASKLPSKYAEAVHYDVVLILKQAEIAERLGISLTATKSRIQRGKKMLKAIYENELKK
jgi:RNA polymerase sigma-70 factor, ECF subfamily